MAEAALLQVIHAGKRRLASSVLMSTVSVAAVAARSGVEYLPGAVVLEHQKPNPSGKDKKGSAMKQ